MSSEKKEDTKTFSNFGFNVDSDHSKFTEVPTITNLLGRKKLKPKGEEEVKPKTKEPELSKTSMAPPQAAVTSPSLAPPPTPALTPVTAAPMIEALEAPELTEAPKEGFFHRTTTGFNTFQEKKPSENPVIKKILTQRAADPTLPSLQTFQSNSALDPQILSKTEELKNVGAISFVFLKKNEKGNFSTHYFHGKNHLKNIWNGIELKKTTFPDLTPLIEKDHAVHSLNRLPSHKSIFAAFGLNVREFHFFIPCFSKGKDSGFFILSAEKDIQNELKNSFQKHPAKKAA